MALIRFQNSAVLLALPLLLLFFGVLAWRRGFKPLGPALLRVTIAGLAVLALADPIRPATTTSAAVGDHERVVILVDQSASIGDALGSLRAEAARLAQLYPASAVLFFGDRPALVGSPSSPYSGQPVGALPLDLEITDLEQALSMGAKLLTGGPGRLLLLSDGLATDGDTPRAVDLLAQAGIPVDAMHPPTAPGRDQVRLVNLLAPPVLRQGETFELEILVHSPGAVEIELTLWQDEGLLADDRVPLGAGVNRFHYQARADEMGSHTFRATAELIDGQDPQPINNSYSAFSQVYSPPRILVVGEDPLQVRTFSDWLRQAGFIPRVITPSELPSQMSDLERFDGMALFDLPARALELEQMIAIQEFVRSLGRGLVVTGGRNSYSLGQYGDTPLEELLPLSLEPPPREERPPVALLLIIDHSGSMAGGGPATKLAMAKEAAIRATDTLGPDDLIGVLIFDSSAQWVVPFQRVGDGATFLEIQGRIAAIPGGGGTQILDALEMGLPALAEQQFADGARHAVLLTDGRSFDGPRGPEAYDQLVDAARQADITLSTIAIGIDADQQLLARLAERGLGRYHFAAQPEELPVLTIAESAILSSDALQEGQFRPTVAMAHPSLRGLFAVAEDGTAAAPPTLEGYIGLTPKPRGEVVMEVGPGDPLLGVWGYGLGRVAAWSSDAGQDWTSGWRGWPDVARFWGQIVGYTVPAPDLGQLQVGVELAPGGVVTLVAEGVDSSGSTVDLAPTRATLITPAGREVALSLLQVAPGRYEQRLRLRDPGAYQLTVTQSGRDGPDEVATTGFVLPYPAEYALTDPGEGEATLRYITETTGGKRLAYGETPSVEERSAAGTDQTADARQLWPLPLMAALLLWPAEIAWRRRRRLRIQ